MNWTLRQRTQKEIDEEIIYLESVLSYIDNAITNDDITKGKRIGKIIGKCYFKSRNR